MPLPLSCTYVAVACLAFLWVIEILFLFWGALLSASELGWNRLQGGQGEHPISPTRVSDAGGDT